MISFWFYFLLFSSLLLTFVSVVLLSFYSRLHFLAILIAAIGTGLVAFQWNNLDQIRAQPLTTLKDRFIIMNYIESKPDIYLWVSSPERSYPITVRIPWTEEDAEKLAESEEEMKTMGIEAEIDGDEIREGILEIYSFDYTESIVKEE